MIWLLSMALLWGVSFLILLSLIGTAEVDERYADQELEWTLWNECHATDTENDERTTSERMDGGSGREVPLADQDAVGSLWFHRPDSDPTGNNPRGPVLCDFWTSQPSHEDSHGA